MLMATRHCAPPKFISVSLTLGRTRKEMGGGGAPPLSKVFLSVFFFLYSLRSRRLEVVGERENGRVRGVRERLHGRRPKIVSTRIL